MRVFVTGASGHIGSALLPELLAAGHEVLGLARSDAAEAKVAGLGAEVRRGALDDLDGLREAAASADAVIHLAAKPDGQPVIEAIGQALAGTGRPFVAVSGTLALAFGGITGRPGTELDVLGDANPLGAAENVLLKLAHDGVRSVVVRLPPTVHSTLDTHGFIPGLVGIARAKGVAGYAGAGANRWPAGHTLDVARLLRLAAEKAPAGARLHAAAEQGIEFREIAETIGRHLGLPAEPIAAAVAAEHFGYLAPFVGLDNPTSAQHTRELLGWQPAGPGLIADLDEGHYFG